MKSKNSIIGITGAFGSGKSTAASFFESKGFRTIILSSFLEEEAKKRGVKKITRKILQDIGNEWRTKFGKGILTKKALEKSEKEKEKGNWIIDGIRNVGEIDTLRKNDNFVLLAVVVDRKTRFERLKKLKRREELTWEIFTKLDKRDLGLGESASGLQVAASQALADIFIENNGSKKVFEGKLEEFLKTKIYA